MAEDVLCRPAGEGKTWLVGGGDYVTMKTRGNEVDERFCTFEVASTPGFGPPLHTHAWAEFFYVLEGEYEFQRVVDGQVETVLGGRGTTLSVPAGAAHTFHNATSGLARMLVVHAPAGLEDFFEAYGVEVAHVGDVPAGLEPPDPAQMAEVLPRHGVHVVAELAGSHA
jgi:quercetin dioxygenase-like cupin family protein